MRRCWVERECYWLGPVTVNGVVLSNADLVAWVARSVEDRREGNRPQIGGVV